MSVEIRWPVGARNEAVTQWGVIDYPDPRPDRGEVGPLIIAVAASLHEEEEYYARGCTPEGRTRWQYYSGVRKQSGRLFLSTAYPIYSSINIHDDSGWIFSKETQSWTWELFPAHFADGEGPYGVYVGRWPD